MSLVYLATPSPEVLAACAGLREAAAHVGGKPSERPDGSTVVSTVCGCVNVWVRRIVERKLWVMMWHTVTCFGDVPRLDDRWL